MQRSQSIRKSSKTMVIQLPQQVIPLKVQPVKKAIPTNLIRGLPESKKQQIKQPPPPPSPPKVVKVQPIKQIKEQKKQQLSEQAKLAKLQIKKWREMSESLQKRREEEFHLLKKKLQLQRQKSEESRRKQLQAKQQLKRLQILKKQQLKKVKLQEQLKNQHNKKQQKRQPLFQRKEKQFMMEQMAEQQKIKQNIMKKKQQMLLDMEQLKKHQQKFLMHIKDRQEKVKKRKRKSKSPTQGNQQGKHGQSERQYRSQFNKFLTIDPQKKQRQLQKYIRRKKFEQRVKRIPIKIDQQKMKQALIAKDRSENPMKYNYLANVAALSDQKIYDEFKDFEININKNELGNDYMRQMNGKITEASRLRSQSQSQLRTADKIQYKNYLPEVKSLLKRKKIHNNQHQDQVQQIMDRYESQTDRVYVLNQKSQLYRNEAMKKILQIKTNASSNGSYSDYLGKQQMIDELYARSIKMKLASAQIAT